MKRKRIQYNELNEEIYGPRYWTKSRLIITGIALLVFGFLFNFSLEEKINKWLLATLSTNEACPIVFEKAELSYFLPKINIKKAVILGSCFGQPNNKLPLQDFIIGLHSPSFYPPGIKLHVSLKEGRTNINLYPTISPFSQYIDIENTKIDNKIFAAMSSDNQSVISGMLDIEGTLKFSSGTLEDGKLIITSNDFRLPAQNIKGFEMTLLDLKHLDIRTHFTNKTTMQIDHIEIGRPGSPIELKLKGNLLINPTSFISSQLQLSGPLKLSNFILMNFAFIKLFLPAENTSGTYQVKINGPLGNMGPPQIK
ncbi:MAG: hypothetical protein PHY93_04455 [Bacteriovorax sp.]|nr:hypothetical protein [Bacteriovorax sp.]